MTAPALVMVTEGYRDSYVEQVAHRLRRQMQLMRPELSIHLAFTDSSSPTGLQVAAALAGRGTQEAVLVPLDLVRVCESTQATQQMAARMRRQQPGLKIALARPIGPASELLNVLDLHLRAVLTNMHCAELDALVLSAPTCGDTRGSALLARRARQWSSHHKLPVAIACADGSGHTMSSAITALRDQGRRSIAVGSLFLAPDATFCQQTEQALAAGVIAVGAPVGADDTLLQLVMGRYAYAAMGMLDDFDDEPANQAISQGFQMLAGFSG